MRKLADMGDPNAVKDPVVAGQLRQVIENVERLASIADRLEAAVKALDVSEALEQRQPIKIIGGRGARVTKQNGVFVVEAI